MERVVLVSISVTYSSTWLSLTNMKHELLQICDGQPSVESAVQEPIVTILLDYCPLMHRALKDLASYYCGSPNSHG